MKLDVRKITLGITSVALGLGISSAAFAMGSKPADSAKASKGEVNVYTYRQEFLIKPLFDAFTNDTGIKVNVVFAKKGLVERLKQEGKNTKADILLTADVGHLESAMDQNVLAPVNDDEINKNIPAEYRGPNGEWFGLTSRARLIYTSKDRVKIGDIKDYEDLANPKWKGKICTRAGDHPYNIALIASMIAHHGEAKAKTWLEGWKANLAQKPQGNDRSQVKAVKEGVCDIAIGNSYYYGKMLENPEQKAWAEAVNLVFPNQGNRGTHMNISGMAMTKYAKNKEATLSLMRYLSEPKAQKIYAEGNFEYPVNSSVKPSELVASWGDFKRDKISIEEVAKLRKKAAQLVNETKFNL